MKPKKFSVLLLSVSLLVILSAKVSAQTNSCAVKMEVTRYDSEIFIKGANVKAVNQETKKVYFSALKDEMPYFAELPEGDYRVTVTKAGFMRSADDYYLDCSESESEDEGVNWSIELYQGSSKKIIKLYDQPKRTVLTIMGASDSNAPPTPPTETKPPPPPISTIPKIVSGGVLNGKAVNLVKPKYPPAAMAVRASGAVSVQVTINEEGNVISATAVSGHALLRAAAEKAARDLKFSPTILSGQFVKVTGVVIYNFTLPEPKKENQ